MVVNRKWVNMAHSSDNWAYHIASSTLSLTFLGGVRLNMPIDIMDDASIGMNLESRFGNGLVPLTLRETTSTATTFIILRYQSVSRCHVGMRRDPPQLGVACSQGKTRATGHIRQLSPNQTWWHFDI